MLRLRNPALPESFIFSGFLRGRDLGKAYLDAESVTSGLALSRKLMFNILAVAGFSLGRLVAGLLNKGLGRAGESGLDWEQGLSLRGVTVWDLGTG